MGEAGDPRTPDRLERMLARSPYRGTPQRHVEGGLAIAVQTRGWDASLATVGNWTVAIHGVIGNWPELAPAHGWDFPEDASSATKLAIAYEHLGDDLFAKLRGEYSILIHDRREHTLIAVRDLWGRRPLFFERKGSTTYIASEIRQILAGSETLVEIDGDVLIQAIQWKPTYPTRTHVKGIGRVQAGQINTLRRNQPGDPQARQRTWEPPEAKSNRYNFEELTEELRFLIQQAVDRWLIGIPFVVSLSGGVDSSTIWWVISQKARAGDPRASMGRAFSYRLQDKSVDESPQISRILEAIGTDNHTFIDSPRTNATRFLFQNAERMDSPFYGALSRDTNIPIMIDEQPVELVLGGFGGDLVLGGASEYLIDLLRDRQLVQFFLDLWTLETKPGQSRLAFVASKTAAPLWRHLKLRPQQHQDQVQPGWIHKSRLHVIDSSTATRDCLGFPRQRKTHQNRILHTIEMQQGLSAQEGAEQLRASKGLALGSPLVDIDILNFAFRTPSRAFSDGRRYKQLLRNVAYDRLSEPIREWKNPYATFALSPEESASLENLVPPRSWTLVEKHIIDCPSLESMFEESKANAVSSSELGDLAVAEAVIRQFSCSQ